MNGGPVLVLVGAPASGKSTVGRAVARRLGVGFRDTDADVETTAGTSVADLFVDRGEPYFRQLEEQAVAAALAGHDGVVSLGGGAVLSDATRALLVGYARGGGTVVWLDVDLPSAAKRAGLSRDRPLLAVNPRAMLRTLLEARTPLYREVATAVVHNGARPLAGVVDEVAGHVPTGSPAAGDPAVPTRPAEEPT